MLSRSKFALASASAALVLSFGLFGCSNNEQASTDASSDNNATEEVVVEEPSYTEIGTNSASSTGVLITNDSKKSITNIAFKANTEDAYPAGLMSDNQKWADGETCLVYVDKANDPCSVLVTCGEATYELHDIELASMTEASLKISDEGVPYLVYTANGKEVSTLEAEQALLQAQADAEAAAQAEAEAAAQAQAEAEAAAQAQAEAEAAAAATPTYDYSYNYSYDSSSSNGGSSSGNSGGSTDVSQGSDGCVSGGIVLR